MSPEKAEEILSKIDSIIGPPEQETPEERQKRREMIQRDARRRAALKSAKDRR